VAPTDVPRDGVVRSAHTGGEAGNDAGRNRWIISFRWVWAMPDSDQNSKAMLDAVFARLFDLRTVVIGAEVDDAVANLVISQLLLLGAENSNADVRLYIDSPGGSLPSALAIHDAMNFVPCDVSTWAIGRVGSVGNLILSSGTRGKRYATSTSLISLGCSSDLRRHADRASRERWHTELVGLTARLTGQPIEQVSVDLETGPTLTAFNARGYGLIDSIVDMASGGPQSN
jgi:ATP-dependent Clp protease protease subunit